MKILRNAVLVSIVGIVSFIGDPMQAHAQDVTAIHPANYPEVGTLVVKRRLHLSRKTYLDVVIEKGTGFATTGCDFMTTFSAIAGYEKREAWPEERLKIEVAIAGKTYEGRLRPVGVYPFGLDLACIDLAAIPPDKHPVTYPLALAMAPPSNPSHDETLSTDIRPGTPFVDEKNRVVGMLILDAHGSPYLLSSSDLRRFLNEAKKVPSAWPSLLQR